MRGVSEKAFGFDPAMLPVIRNAGVSRESSGASLARYTLPHDEINLIASGRFETFLNGAAYSPRPGNAYLYVKGDVFGPSTSDPGGELLICRWVKFDLPGESSGSRVRFPRRVPLTTTAQRDLHSAFDRMLDARMRNGRGDATRAAGCLLEIFGLLESEAERWKPEFRSRKGLGEAADRKLAAGLAFMETRFAQRMKIAQVAEAAGLSEDYFERLFRKRMGHPPLAHLIGLRLSEGRRLLARMPQWTVAEIARKAGFDDAKYFTRMFRKTFGVSPREFRTLLSASWRGREHSAR